MIFALFKDPILVLLIFCNKNRATQNKKEKQSGKHLFRHFLFSSANFFFDLRVNNRVVVIINYPHKVKTNKTHSLINRNKQRKTAFRFACTWSPRVRRDCASHIDRQQKIELTHRYIKDLFIKFEVVERKSHTNTQKYQLSEISSSPTVKPFKPIKYTHKPIKNLMVFNHTTSRSFIIITITLSLFVTVKCIGYI